MRKGAFGENEAEAGGRRENCVRRAATWLELLWALGRNSTCTNPCRAVSPEMGGVPFLARLAGLRRALSEEAAKRWCDFLRWSSAAPAVSLSASPIRPCINSVTTAEQTAGRRTTPAYHILNVTVETVAERPQGRHSDFQRRQIEHSRPHWISSEIEKAEAGAITLLYHEKHS